MYNGFVLAVTILILEERMITMYATASAMGEAVDILLVTGVLGEF